MDVIDFAKFFSQVTPIPFITNEVVTGSTLLRNKTKSQKSKLKNFDLYTFIFDFVAMPRDFPRDYPSVLSSSDDSAIPLISQQIWASPL